MVNNQTNAIDDSEKPFQYGVREHSNAVIDEFAKEAWPSLNRWWLIAKLPQSPPGVESSHSKSVLRMLQRTLQEAAPGKELNLDFDEDGFRGFKAAVKELDIVFSTEDNGFLKDFFESGIKKILKNTRRRNSKLKYESFELVLLRAVEELMEIFWSHINAPDYFHTYKVKWLERLNEKLMSFPPVSTSASQEQVKEFEPVESTG